MSQFDDSGAWGAVVVIGLALLMSALVFGGLAR